MLRLYPDEDEVRSVLQIEGWMCRPECLQVSPEVLRVLLKSEALEGYEPEQEYPADLNTVDMAMSNETFASFQDEDDMLMQAAPNDTYLALQLLRSQFPAKARVGIYLCLPADQNVIQFCKADCTACATRRSYSQ